MRRFLTAIFLLNCACSIHAQDQHYWSQMGGINAGLLGGSAVAGLHDNNSLYYNPASMAFVENQSISLGANTLTMGLIFTENAFGNEEKDVINTLILNPDMVGGILFSKKNDRLRTGYAINTRHLAEQNFFTQVRRTTDTGDLFVGDFDLNNRSQESWVNMASSYRVNNHLGLGLTFIVAIRSENYSNTISGKSIPRNQGQETQRSDSKTQYNYWNVKGLFRLGLSLDYETFRFGANVTLPSFNLFGLANVKREITLINNTDTLTGLPQDLIVLDMDESLGTTHKYPLSTAIGASYKLKNKDWIHFSAEAFMPIKTYAVFKSDQTPLAYPDGTSDLLPHASNSTYDFLQLNEQANFVINFSVGYESFISDNWGLLAGFRTDFNYSEDKGNFISEIEPYTSDLDRYHFTGGVWGNFKNKKFTAGLETSFSPRTRTSQFVNFSGTTTNTDLPLIGEAENSAYISGVAFTLFLGIEVMFDGSNK